MTFHIWKLLMPYTTKKGKDEYHRLVDEFGFVSNDEFS